MSWLSGLAAKYEKAKQAAVDTYNEMEAAAEARRQQYTREGYPLNNFLRDVQQGATNAVDTVAGVGKVLGEAGVDMIDDGVQAYNDFRRKNFEKLAREEGPYFEARDVVVNGAGEIYDAFQAGKQAAVQEMEGLAAKAASMKKGYDNFREENLQMQREGKNPIMERFFS